MTVRRFILPAVLAASCGFLTRSAPAADYYVSNQGNDAWSGRLPEPNADGTDGPFLTLDKAASVAVAGDVCHLRAGVYRQTLRPQHSGRPGQPIVFRNYRDELAILSGADALSDWQEQDGVYWAAMDWDLEDQNQLFAGDTMLTEARWPNNTGTLMQPVRGSATAGTPTTLTDPQLPGDAGDWTGATLWCAGGRKWICWSGRVTAFDPQARTLTFESQQAAGKWYTPRAGSEYVLMGVRAALETEGERWYDLQNGRVHLIPPGRGRPRDGQIEAKRRLHAIDLSGRSHVHVIGLHFRAAGILTDADSKDLVLDGLDGRYVGHSFVRDVSRETAVLIRGERNTVRNSLFAYSSGSILRLEGREHRLINCYIHNGNYGAKWSGAVSAAGRRHLVSHNTIRHSGRDLVTVHGLMESVIQHNDLSHAGWLTHDLGMIYGHNTDFMNTVIRYNRVHDNQAAGLAMGIYFDHLSHNVIVHSNALWNISGDAIRINNPSYFNLVANNTCYHTNTAARAITSFDHSHRQDLFGTRWYNNLLNAPLRLPDNAIASHNSDSADPGYADPGAQRFELRADSPAAGAGLPLPGITGTAAADLGAFARGEPAWDAGHDFARPPQPEPAWAEPDMAWMNLVDNACFETGTLEGWTKNGAEQAAITDGNGWGNNFGSGESVPTGTSRHELRLGGGVDGVEQRVARLEPDTRYTLSAWIRVSEGTESVRIGVRDAGGSEHGAETSNVQWTRLVVEFATGADQRAATVFLKKTTPGPGYAWCDNVGLPRVSR